MGRGFKPLDIHALGRLMARVARLTGTLRVPVSPCLRVFFGDVVTGIAFLKGKGLGYPFPFSLSPFPYPKGLT